MARTTTDRPTTTLTVEVVRSGDWWAIAVPELPGVFSQCRRLEQVEDHAREAIAIALDVEPALVTTLDLRVMPPDDVAALLEQLGQTELAAQQAVERATRGRRDAARTLASRGYPMRDIGRLLGISHQRVSQILADTD